MSTILDITAASAAAARELERFRNTDADRAWRLYLMQRVEVLKERQIDAEDRDAVASQIRLIREILRETAAPPVRLQPQKMPADFGY